MERRNDPRHPLTCDVEQLPSSGKHQSYATTPTRTFRATTVNVSSSGACLVSKESVEQFSVLPCYFQFPSVPVPVPLLMQVRWVKPVTHDAGLFRIGVEFLP